MTSISTVTTNQFVFQSPRDRLQNELTSEIAAGTIAATDLDPLSAALDSIDQTLTSQRSSDRAAGTAPPSPDEMKAKIDELIAAQVSSGKLTSEQADELKNVFSNTFSSGPGGPGGPGGAQGTDDGSDSDSTQSSSLGTNIQELLANFLKMLQQTMSETSAYGSNSQTKSVTAALIVDFQS